MVSEKTRDTRFIGSNLAEVDGFLKNVKKDLKL